MRKLMQKETNFEPSNPTAVPRRKYCNHRDSCKHYIAKLTKKNQLNPPETSRRPEVNFFRNTTLFPLNLPARRINTVPGVMDALILGAFLTGAGPFCLTTSSAG
jgi:hypothetical protein